MYLHSTTPPPSAYSSMSSISGIQGKILEVTVVGCNKLKDTEWISRQDPYVCVEYASTKFRTRTCTDGGKNPTFQEKFVFTLIEGLRELSIVVWNSNTLTFDDFIGSGKIQLQKVLSQGYDDSPWSLQSKTGRYAGEVRLILHYAGANLDKPPKTYAPSAPPYLAPQIPQSSAYYTQPSPAPAAHYPQQPSASPYPPPPSAYPPPPSAYPPPPSPYNSYPPQSSAYPPSPYQPSAYPPQPYPPPTAYPPSPYPPSSQPPPYYPPPGPYPGMYPPPPH